VFLQRLALALGLLLLLLGYLGFIMLNELSKQFFRQEIEPWLYFSTALMAAGLTLTVAWLAARIAFTSRQR